MKNYMIVRQRVADLDRFQDAFDSLQPRRREYGLTDLGQFRADDDPHTVIVVMEVADVERAKAYWHSSILERGRQQAGVVGPIAAGTDQVWLTHGPVRER